MCYYRLYLHLQCGHAIPSRKALPSSISPPCPYLSESQALFTTPMMTSPIEKSFWTESTIVPNPGPLNRLHTRKSSNADRSDDMKTTTDQESQITAVAHKSTFSCPQRLSHPLHTYKLNSLCLDCRAEREERLARFEIGVIRDEVIRESVIHRPPEKQKILRVGYGSKSRFERGSMDEQPCGSDENKARETADRMINRNSYVTARHRPTASDANSSFGGTTVVGDGDTWTSSLNGLWNGVRGMEGWT